MESVEREQVIRLPALWQEEPCEGLDPLYEGLVEILPAEDEPAIHR